MVSQVTAWQGRKDMAPTFVSLHLPTGDDHLRERACPGERGKRRLRSSKLRRQFGTAHHRHDHQYRAVPVGLPVPADPPGMVPGETHIVWRRRR